MCRGGGGRGNVTCGGGEGGTCAMWSGGDM